MLCDFMDILTCKHPLLNLENFDLDSKTYITYLNGWRGYLQCLGLTKFFLGFFVVVGWLYFLFLKFLAQHMISTKKYSIL